MIEEMSGEQLESFATKAGEDADGSANWGAIAFVARSKALDEAQPEREAYANAAIRALRNAVETEGLERKQALTSEIDLRARLLLGEHRLIDDAQLGAVELNGVLDEFFSTINEQELRPILNRTDTSRLTDLPRQVLARLRAIKNVLRTFREVGMVTHEQLGWWDSQKDGLI